MSTFGATLRGERENRALSIRELAEKLGVDRDRLLALERNDFEALPDDATMMPLLHTYAAYLGVDADLMIEDYQQERQKCLEQLSRAVDRVAAVPSVAPRPRVRRASPFPRLLALSAIAGALVILGGWWLVTTEPTAKDDGARVGVTQSESHPTEADSPAVVAATTAPIVPSHPDLTVPEHGVGTAVRNRRLVGQGDRFEQGAKVWYWTEIEGGEAGDRIDHVWLADGKETARIQLRLGGPRWRTYSAKTLHSGSARDWAVEVRELSGRVLARREFVAVR